MTTGTASIYRLTTDSEGAGDFKRYLQGILNAYHETAHPAMEVPDSKRFVLRVSDDQGQVVGGAIFWAYWGWVDVSLLALEPHVRGQGIGQRLMAAIEAKAREEGCTRLRVETFEHELGFYEGLGYRIVGHLADYPEGFDYYWLRKDLGTAPRGGRSMP
jgi:GNAT superfamily N-acetyltransferase